MKGGRRKIWFSIKGGGENENDYAGWGGAGSSMRYNHYKKNSITCTNMEKSPSCFGSVSSCL